MKKNTLYLIIFTIIFAGCSKNQLTTQTETQVEVNSNIPEELLDESGQVDEDKFESNQAVSESDNLDDIETELDNTIILEEDLSDLEAY